MPRLTRLRAIHEFDQFGNQLTIWMSIVRTTPSFTAFHGIELCFKRTKRKKQCLLFNSLPWGVDQHNLAKMIWNIYKNRPTVKCLQLRLRTGPRLISLSHRIITGRYHLQDLHGCQHPPHLIVKFFVWGGVKKNSLTELKMILDLFFCWR